MPLTRGSSLLLKLTRDLDRLIAAPSETVEILDLQLESEYRHLNPAAIPQLYRALVLFASYLDRDLLHPVAHKRISTFLTAETSKNAILLYLQQRESFDSIDWVAIHNLLRLSPTYFHPIANHITARCYALLAVDIKTILERSNGSVDVYDTAYYRRIVSTFAILAALPIEAQLSSLVESKAVSDMLTLLKRLLTMEDTKESSTRVSMDAFVVIDHIASLLCELCVTSDDSMVLQLSSVLALSRDLCRTASTLRLLLQSILASLRMYYNAPKTPKPSKPKNLDHRRSTTLRSAQKKPKPPHRTREASNPLCQLCEGDVLYVISHLLIHGDREVRAAASQVLALSITIAGESATDIKERFSCTAFKFHVVSLLEIVRCGFPKSDSNKIWPETDVRESAASAMKMIVSHMSSNQEICSFAAKLLRSEGEYPALSYCYSV